MAELILDDKNFEAEVEKSKVPVLVDFWAPWCGPCRIQGPTVQELAKDYEGKNVKIAKLNVDEAPTSAQKYHIMSIPTIMIFQNGKPSEPMVGVQTKEVLQKKLDEIIK